MKRKSVLSLTAAAFAALSIPMFAQMPGGAMKQVVGVAEVEEVANVQSRRYTGQVVAQAEVNVVPRVSGEILKLGFNDGDYVKKGQMLYTIEKTQYEAAVKQAEATIAECKARLEYAQSTYDRNQMLYEVNATSKDTMENTKSALDAMRAELAAAEAGLVTAQYNLDHTTITAAIDGQAGVTNFTAGNYITPSSGTMLSIIQMKPIRVRFAMSTSDFLSGYGNLAALKSEGQVSLKLADGSEYADGGKVEFLNNEANVKTDAVQVYASFPNADLKLIPGSTVTVTLSKKSAEKMPAVPPSAVMHDAKESFVYVLTEGNKIERRMVELGDMTKMHQLVKSGLKAGEKVVSQGTHKVMPGDEVVPAPLAGVISLSKLPVAEYPEIAPPTLFVSAMYPGASGEVIAQTVAMPIEDQINGVDDLLYFSSTCSNDGSYSCEVTFQSGTDTDIAMVNLQNAIKRAEPQLPSDVTKLGISVEKRGNEILAVFVFMTDETTLNLMELNNYVNVNVKDSITRLEGVAAASVMSLEEYSMRIWLDPLRMAGLGISTSDISQAVQSQNIQAAAGSIGTEKSNSFMSFKLNVKGRLTTAEEFGNIVLRGPDREPYAGRERHEHGEARERRAGPLEKAVSGGRERGERV